MAEKVLVGKAADLCGLESFGGGCPWQWDRVPGGWEGLFIMMVAFCLSLPSDVITSVN